MLPDPSANSPAATPMTPEALAAIRSRAQFDGALSGIEDLRALLAEVDRLRAEAALLREACGKADGILMGVLARWEQQHRADGTYPQGNGIFAHLKHPYGREQAALAGPEGQAPDPEDTR
jgi:hypothetical protein